MQDECDVSVVIACHNCAGTVGRAFASAINQTRPPRQIILVDDASTDETPAILRKLVDNDKGRAHMLAGAVNGGPSVARNVGWGAAIGCYVAFLDADDEWLPRKLEVQSEWMDEHPECVFSGHEWLGAKQGATGWRWIKLHSLIFSNPFRPSTVMIRRDAPARFDERKRHSEDFALWLNLVADGARAAVLNAPLTRVFETQWLAGGLSAALLQMERSELDNLRQLRQNKKITHPDFLAAYGWSLAKFGRRWILRRVKQ